MTGPRQLHPALGWGMALAVIALFCSLGAWQLGRSEQKRALLAGVEAVLSARHALPLRAAADPAHAADYDWTAGPGHFIEAPAVLLDNQNRGGRAGVRVYRAFQPADAAPALLVDLGWLPLPGDRVLPRTPRPGGEQRLQGLLSPPLAGGIATAAPAVQQNGDLLVIAIEPAALATALRLPELAPRVLRLDPAQALGHVRDLDVLPNTLPPERHLGYAVQWFGLAAAVLITALLLSLRKSRTRNRRNSR